MDTITCTLDHNKSIVTAAYLDELDAANAPPLLDLAAVQHLRESVFDADSWQDFVAVFLHESTDAITALEQAHYNNDTQSLVMVSHRLKGIFGTVGASKLYKLAAMLELKCRANDWEDMSILLLKLSDYYAQTIECLREYMQTTKSL